MNNWEKLIDELEIKNKEYFKKVEELEIFGSKDKKGLFIRGCFCEEVTLPLLEEVESLLSKQMAPYEVALFPKGCQYLDGYLKYRLGRKFVAFYESPLTITEEDECLSFKLPSPFYGDLWREKKAASYLEEVLAFLGEEKTIDVCVDGALGDALEVMKEKEEEAVQKAVEHRVHREKVAGKVKETARDHVLFGQSILEEGTPPESITEPMKNIVYYGRIADLEERPIKGKKVIITFLLLGKKSGISCKLFAKEDEAPALKKGTYVKVRGNGERDEYRGGFVFSVKAINTYATVIGAAKEEVPRVELHLHTRMSALDATVDVGELMKKMKAYGHDTVAITDHGVVQAFPEAHDQAKQAGIKIIYGMEGYLYDDFSDPNYKGRANHIILLVKDKVGLKNLYRLVSLSHLEHYYRVPRIPKSKLLELREGILIGSACEVGELYQAFVNGRSDEEIEEIAALYDYFELQPLSNNEFMVRNGILGSNEDIKAINRRILELGDRMNKLVVATCDVHFLEADDDLYRAVLMKSKGFNDVTQPSLYYRSTPEMLEEFSYLGDERAYEIVVTNTRKIADEIAGDLQPVPSDFYPPEIEGAEDQVKEIVESTACSFYGDPVPDVVRARLDKELNSIITHGFSVLYLIAHKLVKKSNEDGYMVGSRGSVGSSLVATMMGITEVNPLPPHYRCPQCKHSEFILDGSYSCGVDMPQKVCPECGTPYEKDGHQIPFETFLGFDGDKVPDIDLNFSGEYQPIIHKYTEEIFGKGNVFKAGTISTVADKTAFGFVKKYYEEGGMPLPNNPSISAIASGCTGVKRTTGQHPGGLMVVPKTVDIHEFTPLQRPADDTSSDIITTHFDYHSISERLVKLDLLGHDDPTIIKYLEEMTGVDPKMIPLDEPRVMSLFTSPEALDLREPYFKVGSLGLPEFGTKFVREMLLDAKPQVFSDLIRISGFSHGTDVWLNNAKDLIVSGKVKLSEAISVRDDIMTYLLQKNLPDLAAFKIMEAVRKGKGLTEEYEALMREHKVPGWYIESCKKISYMFPKAHATAYVTMAYRLGYFKVYHKEAFYASYFSIRGNLFDLKNFIDGEDSILRQLDASNHEMGLTPREKELRALLEIGYEMYLRGVEFLNVDILNSDAKRFKVVDGKLLPPFSAIPGLGVKAADNLVKERERSPFLSVADLQRRGKINQTIVEEMLNMHILDGMPLSEQLSLF